MESATQKLESPRDPESISKRWKEGRGMVDGGRGEETAGIGRWQVLTQSESIILSTSILDSWNSGKGKLYVRGDNKVSHRIWRLRFEEWVSQAGRNFQDETIKSSRFEEENRLYEIANKILPKLCSSSQNRIMNLWTSTLVPFLNCRSSVSPPPSQPLSSSNARTQERSRGLLSSVVCTRRESLRKSPRSVLVEL